MDTNMLLYISFILYIVVMVIATLFKIRWIYAIAGLFWFIPIFEIDNMFIVIISASMLLVHFLLAFYSQKGDDFE